MPTTRSANLYSVWRASVTISNPEGFLCRLRAFDQLLSIADQIAQPVNLIDHRATLARQIRATDSAPGSVSRNPLEHDAGVEPEASFAVRDSPSTGRRASGFARGRRYPSREAISRRPCRARVRAPDTGAEPRHLLLHIRTNFAFAGSPSSAA